MGKRQETKEESRKEDEGRENREMGNEKGEGGRRGGGLKAVKGENIYLDTHINF